MTLITTKSNSIPKRAIIGLENIENGAKSASIVSVGSSGGGSTVKIDAYDGNSGYLSDKIVVGGGLQKNIITDTKNNKYLELVGCGGGFKFPAGIVALDDLVYLSDSNKVERVSTYLHSPIGIVKSIDDNNICEIANSGEFTFKHDKFDVGEIGKIAFWDAVNGIYTSNQTSIDNKIGIITAVNKIIIDIDEGIAGTIKVLDNDIPEYLLDKIVGISGINIGYIYSDNKFKLTIGQQNQIPSSDGASGKILTSNGTNAMWADNATAPTDYFQTNKTLKIAKQGNETGGASEQSIYSPNYTTWDGANGLFVRNSGEIDITSSVTGFDAWISESATSKSIGLFTALNGATNSYVSLAHYGGVATAKIKADKFVVPIISDTAASGLATINADGELRQAAPGVHAIKTLKFTLTRAQVLALSTTPKSVLTASDGVCYLPIKLLWQGGAVNYYSGVAALFYGSTYASTRVITSIGLTGLTSAARYGNATTPPNSICENQPIYIGASSAITDGGTSSDVTFWLEYTELNLNTI